MINPVTSTGWNLLMSFVLGNVDIGHSVAFVPKGLQSGLSRPPGVQGQDSSADMALLGCSVNCCLKQHLPIRGGIATKQPQRCIYGWPHTQQKKYCISAMKRNLSVYDINVQSGSKTVQVSIHVGAVKL